MLVAASEAEKAKGFHVHLEDGDIAALMRALLKSERRVQKLELSAILVDKAADLSRKAASLHFHAPIAAARWRRPDAP
jgi:hypothetical protein